MVLRQATPADATLACEQLTTLWSVKDPALVACMVPLVRWLLTNGSAELRRAERAMTLRNMCVISLGHAPELLPTLFRYVLLNERPSSVQLGMFADDGPMFWEALEHAAEHGASDDLLGDFVQACGAWSGWSAAVTFAPWLSPDFPASARVLTKALHTRELPGWSTERHWQAAFRLVDPRPELMVAISTGRLKTGLEATRYAHQDHGDALLKAAPPPERIDAWIRTLVGEYLRRHELDRPYVDRHSRPYDVGTATPRWQLTHLSGWVHAAPGIGLAVRDAIAAGEFEGDTTLASELLDVPRLEHGHVAAALAALPSGRKPRGTPPAARVEELRRVFERIVQHPWIEPVYGIDVRAALGAATRVELKPLAGDDKVHVAGDALVVDLDTAVELAKIPNDDRRAPLAAIYVVHELVHVVQGLGTKAMVGRLRAAGGETTLMHVDLAADHAAALVVAAAFPKWSLEHLKDLQGTSLGAYPVGWMHPAPARARKAVRLVSLRADLAVRREGGSAAKRLGGGYAFADFGAGGGEFLVFSSGPVLSLLHAATLTKDKADTLHAAADAAPVGTSVSEVDNIVRALLA